MRCKLKKGRKMAFRSGFISIIGRPNAGKSTLLNSITGQKISIVSPKPQTTRNVIRGVLNREDCQLIFIDTPGIHKGKGLLNEFMVKEAVSSLSDVDAVVLLIEAEKPVTDDDRLVLEAVAGLKCPVILGINKVDSIRRHTPFAR
jgi:GTP-binding protein Era